MQNFRQDWVLNLHVTHVKIVKHGKHLKHSMRFYRPRLLNRWKLHLTPKKVDHSLPAFAGGVRQFTNPLQKELKASKELIIDEGSVRLATAWTAMDEHKATGAFAGKQ